MSEPTRFRMRALAAADALDERRKKRKGCGACAVLHRCSNELGARRPIRENSAECRRRSLLRGWCSHASACGGEAPPNRPKHDWNAE